MNKLIDLTGKKFGKLMVIKRNYPNKWGQPMWLCRCECGEEKIIDGSSLKQGITKSCGCLNRLSRGLSNMRARISKYKVSAKKRELEFDLTEEQFKELTQKNCYYCGSLPNNVAKEKRCFGDYIYNGLDRIDNSKGYTIDNVVPCCKDCNRAKYKQTQQEFKDWVRKVYNKMFGEKK